MGFWLVLRYGRADLVELLAGDEAEALAQGTRRMAKKSCHNPETILFAT